MWQAYRGNTDPEFSGKCPLGGIEFMENIYDYIYMKSKKPLNIF